MVCLSDTNLRDLDLLPLLAFAATKSIEVEITTGTDSFGWFDKAGKLMTVLSCVISK